jgi:hypothetical protein
VLSERLAVEKARKAIADAGRVRDQSVTEARNEAELLEGQVRIKLASLSRAEAQRKLAMVETSRLERLASKGPGYVSKSESEKAEAEKQIADAGVEEAKADVEIVKIKLAQARRKHKSMEDAASPGPREKPAAPKTSNRGEVMKNLKMIGLALHNYHSAKGHFPSATGNPEKPDGPPVSWRVAILPFLPFQEDKAANELYKTYHFDEPWDGPHNKRLMSAMPEVFSIPTVQSGPGATRLRAIVGPESVWGIDTAAGAKIADIIDGPHNTLMVVESGAATTWTRPEDITLGASNVMPTLITSTTSDTPGFHALFADGSVRFLKLPIPPNVFSALATKAGGEVLEEQAYGRDPGAGRAVDEEVAERKTAIKASEERFRRLTGKPDQGHAPGLPASEINAVRAGGGDPAAKDPNGAMAGMMRMMAGGAAAPARDPEQRLAEVESKLDRLLKELEEMRKTQADSPARRNGFEDAIKPTIAMLDAEELSNEQVVKDVYAYLMHREPTAEELRTALEELSRPAGRRAGVTALYLRLVRRNTIDRAQGLRR